MRGSYSTPILLAVWALPLGLCASGAVVRLVPGLRRHFLQQNRHIVNIALVGAVAVGVLALMGATFIALTAPSAQNAYASEAADGGASLGVSSASFLSGTAAGEAKVATGTVVSVPAIMVRPLVRMAAPEPKSATKAVKRVVHVKARAVHHASAKPKVVSTGGSGWKSGSVSTFGIGDGLVGHGLAGGGILHANSMVVAHRTLAFGTRVQFRYGGKTCVAVVMDRGPYVHGRVFDLGPGTAKALGFSGVDTVQYKVLGK